MTRYHHDSSFRTIFKLSLFLINFMLLIAGVIITVIGGYIAFTDLSYFKFLSSDDNSIYVQAAGYTMIGIGALTTMVYFLGCCGSCAENEYMLYAFSGMMGLLLTTKIIVAILFFIFRRHAKEVLISAMDEGISHYNHPNHPFYTTGWDKIQGHYKCCGMDDYKDWEVNPIFNGTGRLAPLSCCNRRISGCNRNLKNIYELGCFEQFRTTLEKDLYIFGAIAAGIAIIQLFVAIASCYFGKKAKKGHNWHSMLSVKRYSPC